ncbi:MAG: ATP-binding cassette domain-containing protein [Clostridia bacterium]|nr:ATP-binding cassette domain-containing protein [Clostridia bacterium]
MTTNEKLKTLIAAIIWLAVWQLGSMLVHNELLLPGPLVTVKTLGALALTGVFYINIAWTVARCLIAMIVSFFAGAFFAWISYRHYWARKIADLPVGFFKAVPVMAIIIYVILIAQADWVAIIVCFLMCFPIVYTNILAGLDAMSDEYLELAQVYGLSRGQKLRHIYTPGILPQIKSAISLIAGLSWKAVVAAEILSVPKYSLGYEMMNAKYYLQTPTLFAYIVVIVVLSMAFERLIKSALAHIEWHAYEGGRIHLHAKADEGTVATATQEIALKNVSKSFDEKCVLSGLKLVVVKGEITALMGPSGRGKTTIARILAGLESADSGEVSAPANVSVLFQEDRLLPWLNVRDNIALAGLGRGTGKDADERIKALAEGLEIEETLSMLPSELSGGMKHRAALARTFFADGEMMILDEPFRGLDAQLKDRIIGKLWKQETAGRTVLLITHIPEDAGRLAEKTITV